MPSFTIHLAIASEYKKKHPNDIKDIKAFFDGIITPDFILPKSTSHFQKTPLKKICFKKYLKNQYDASDFEKGYLLHLISDYLFYNVEYKNEYKKIFLNGLSLSDDYYYLNEILKKNYDIILVPKKAKKFLRNKTGNLIYITDTKRLFNYINRVSCVSINNYIKNILEHNEIIYNKKHKK